MASYAAGAPAGGAGGPAAAPRAAPKLPSAKYVCGACGHSQELSQRDQVRCRVCGYRIFYKVRTDRLAQFEAR